MATDLKSANRSETEGVLISTQVSPQVKITQRSILDGKQAWKIAEEAEQQNVLRNETDALIWNKYGEGQPFDPVALASSGQGNRYNFPTGFMSSIIDKVTPTPCKIIDSARFLTSASLNAHDYKTGQIDPAKVRKSEMMREKITKTIRQWPEWKTFYTGLSQEMVVIGRSFAIRLDPFSPWPKFFRTDQAFLPNGTGEHARNIQVLTVKQDLLVHELVNFIKDKQAATDAGWDIQKCVDAINEALPKQLNEDGSHNARAYDDAIREGNLGSSYAGATIVPVTHVFAIEANDTPGETNKVTQYILYRKKEHDVLFKKEDRYERIEDVAALFTLEPGNGKFYGSKGLGRKLINKHLAIERMRNRLYDQLEMAGLVILKTDPARAPSVQFKVRHPFILTSTDAVFEEQVIEANVKAFLDADAKMLDWTQQSVGQYLPSSVTNDMGERNKTAREVSVDFQREAEAKVAFLSRFWGQFADLVSMLQRGLLDPETTDKAAKELQACLLEAGVTREEMKEFANAPAAEVIQDLTQIQNQQIMMVAAKYGNDPRINSRELLIRDIGAMTSPSIAEALVLPEQNMEANVIEAVRAQMMETEAILSPTNNKGIPVSGRDNHEAHLRVLIPDLMQAITGALQVGGAHPQALGKMAAGLTHAQGHLQMWTQAGGDQKVIKQVAQQLNMIDQQLKKLSIMAAKAATQQQDEQAGAEQQAAQQQAPLTPDQLITIYTGKDTPEKVKRQIEMQLGFEPPNAEELAMEDARQATLKHPDLPEKVAAAKTSVNTDIPTGPLAGEVARPAASVEGEGLPPGVPAPPAPSPGVTAPIPKETGAV
jgi:hypothetical protein